MLNSEFQIVFEMQKGLKVLLYLRHYTLLGFITQLILLVLFFYLLKIITIDTNGLFRLLNVIFNGS